MKKSRLFVGLFALLIVGCESNNHLVVEKDYLANHPDRIKPFTVERVELGEVPIEKEKAMLDHLDSRSIQFLESIPAGRNVKIFVPLALERDARACVLAGKSSKQIFINREAPVSRTYQLEGSCIVAETFARDAIAIRSFLKRHNIISPEGGNTGNISQWQVTVKVENAYKARKLIENESRKGKFTQYRSDFSLVLIAKVELEPSVRVFNILKENNCSFLQDATKHPCEFWISTSDADRALAALTPDAVEGHYSLFSTGSEG